MRSAFADKHMKYRNPSRWIAVFAALFGIALPGNAQTDLKHTADSLFTAGKFEQVELLMLRVGSDQGDLTDTEFASMKTTAGFAMIMLDREIDARRYFTEALKINPDLTLDPVMISPKFRVVFNDVKANLQKAEAEAEPELMKTVYRGASPGSHLLNLVLPGAGQLREGYLRGGIFLAAQTASVLLLIDQLNKRSDSRAYYLAQTEKNAIAQAYDDYNRDHKTAWKYGILSGVVYLAAQADLVFIHKPLTNDESRLSIALLPMGNRLLFQVRW